MIANSMPFPYRWTDWVTRFFFWPVNEQITAFVVQVINKLTSYVTWSEGNLEDSWFIDTDSLLRKSYKWDAFYLEQFRSSSLKGDSRKFHFDVHRNCYVLWAFLAIYGYIKTTHLARLIYLWGVVSASTIQGSHFEPSRNSSFVNLPSLF